MNRNIAIVIGIIVMSGVGLASLYLDNIQMQPTPIVNASGVTVKSTIVMQTGAEYQVNNVCTLIYSGKLWTYSHETPIFTVMRYDKYTYQIIAGGMYETFVVGDIMFKVADYDFDHVHLEILEG